MNIVGAFDVHRRQLAFEYLDTVTGELIALPLTARAAAWGVPSDSCAQSWRVRRSVGGRR